MNIVSKKILFFACVSITIAAIEEEPLIKISSAITENTLEPDLTTKIMGIINTTDNPEKFEIIIDPKLHHGLEFDSARKRVSLSNAFVEHLRKDTLPNTLEFEVKKAYGKDKFKDTWQDAHHKRMLRHAKYYLAATLGCAAICAGSVIGARKTYQEEEINIPLCVFASLSGFASGVAACASAIQSLTLCLGSTKTFYLDDKAEEYALKKLSDNELDTLLRHSNHFFEPRIIREIKSRTHDAV